MVNEPVKNSVVCDNELEKIKCLKEMSVEIAEGFAKQFNAYQQLKAEREALVRSLDVLAKRRKEQVWKEETFTRYIPAQSFDSKMITTKLQMICQLLGYCYSLDLNKEIATFHYKSKCYVRFKLSDFQYELTEICPIHSSFEAIKECFERTNDMFGLLSNLRNCFDEIIESTNVPEK